ncbi:MAG: DUF1801 domain-containing protein [Oceanospirillaceae bacterium]|nr:DUF1801 domain-containing protein [Oceanospirillaceae bacterium]
MQFDKDLKSEYKQLFLQVRSLLLEDNNVSESKKARITTYHYAGSGLCHVRTMANGVDIGFLKGVLLEDKFGGLKGSGKKIKVFHINKPSYQELTYYINQAKQLNV